MDLIQKKLQQYIEENPEKLELLPQDINDFILNYQKLLKQNKSNEKEITVRGYEIELLSEELSEKYQEVNSLKCELKRVREEKSLLLEQNSFQINVIKNLTNFIERIQSRLEDEKIDRFISHPIPLKYDVN